MNNQGSQKAVFKNNGYMRGGNGSSKLNTTDRLIILVLLATITALNIYIYIT